MRGFFGGRRAGCLWRRFSPRDEQAVDAAEEHRNPVGRAEASVEDASAGDAREKRPQGGDYLKRGRQYGANLLRAIQHKFQPLLAEEEGRKQDEKDARTGDDAHTGITLFPRDVPHNAVGAGSHGSHYHGALFTGEGRTRPTLINI